MKVKPSKLLNKKLVVCHPNSTKIAFTLRDWDGLSAWKSMCIHLWSNDFYIMECKPCLEHFATTNHFAMVTPNLQNQWYLHIYICIYIYIYIYYIIISISSPFGMVLLSGNLHGARLELPCWTCLVHPNWFVSGCNLDVPNPEQSGALIFCSTVIIRRISTVQSPIIPIFEDCFRTIYFRMIII